MNLEDGMRGRSLLLTAPRRLEWVEDELPQPGPDEILVETVAGAISIGSELPVYLGSARQSQPNAYPRMTGYESVGRVLAVGVDVAGIRPGGRIVSFYGHRTHAILPAAKALPVPEDISDQQAVLAILTCDVAKGIRAVAPWIGDGVLMTGAGAFGLLTVWMLARLGLAAVDVIEPVEARRALALRLGARRAFAPDDAAGGASGYAVGFECSSRADAFTLLQERMRHGGRICVLADGNHEPLPLASAFHEKELTVHGSSDGWDYQAHAAWYWRAVRAAPEVTTIFDAEVPVAGLATAFAALASGDLAAVKVFVRYGASSSPR